MNKEIKTLQDIINGKNFTINMLVAEIKRLTFICDFFKLGIIFLVGAILILSLRSL